MLIVIVQFFPLTLAVLFCWPSSEFYVDALAVCRSRLGAPDNQIIHNFYRSNKTMAAKYRWIITQCR